MLYEMKTGLIGTVRPNKLKSKELNNIAIPKDKTKLLFNTESPFYIFSILNDKKIVYMLNSSYLPGIKNDKLSSHDDFIINSKSVDFCNKKTYQFRYPYGSRKWWKSIFFHLFQISLHNSYVLFKEKKNNKISYMEFYYQVICSFIGDPNNKKKKDN